VSAGVVVVGGGSSVCREIAEAFRRRGDRVHVADVDRAALAATVAANPGMGGTVCDVGSDADVERLFAEAGWLGGVDVLVNGVGIGGPRAPVEEVTVDEWQTVLNVDVTGTFRCIRAVAGGMKERGSGSIVNFSSCSARTAPPLRSPYVAAKTAIEGLTRSLARELGPYGVRCNAIVPGAIENDRLRSILTRNAEAKAVSVDEYRAEVLRYVSLRRSIELDEFAGLVLFLCSDAGRGITGQLLNLDGNVEWEEG
jgi:NAD(P)-dependent dehydrogenase (short-subunit alcohol dehydrogenase family)